MNEADKKLIAAVDRVIRGRIHVGDNREVMQSWPENSIDLCITSPPYWQVRKYGLDPMIYGGFDECIHRWVEKKRKPKGGKGDKANVGANQNNEANMRDGEVLYATCKKCDAFRGELGLEPDYNAFVQHLCDVFDDVYRVLKDTGSLYVVIGDTYYSNHGGGNRGKVNDEQADQIVACEGRAGLKQLPSGCMVNIPNRFAIEMTDNHGWILRNSICWEKKNAMPSSVSSRFTPSFEHVFFFTKSSKVQYWVNDRTMQVVGKSPKGLKGEEGVDWEMIPCSICRQQDPTTAEMTEQEAAMEDIDGRRADRTYKGFTERKKMLTELQEAMGPFPDSVEVISPELEIGYLGGMKDVDKQRLVIDPVTGKPKNTYSGFNDRYTKIPDNTAEQYGSPRARYHRKCKNKRCVDGMKPQSLWRSQKYYFDQQREPAMTPGSKHVGGIDEYSIKTDVLTGVERNMRTVWSIPTKPYASAHFAVFPPALLETPIKASCPEYVCIECGLPTIPIYVKGEPNREWQKQCGGDDLGNYTGQATKDYDSAMAQNPSDVKRRILEGMVPKRRMTGAEQEEQRQKYGAHPTRVDACTIPKGSVYQDPKERGGSASCDCEGSFQPGLVLDPFFGSGTTGQVAKELGRDYVGIDVKEEYCELARERLGLKKPEPLTHEEQTTLVDNIGRLTRWW